MKLNRRDVIKGGLASFGVAAFALFSGKSQANAQKKVTNETFDTVILGAGCAGMACAIEAYDRGGKPVIIEKMNRPAGNTLFATGTINVWGTRFQKAQGIEDSAEEFYKDMMAISGGRGDPELNRVYTDNITEAIHWLADNADVQFEKKILMRPYPRFGRGIVVDKGTYTGGGALSMKLKAAVEKRKIPVFYNTKAVKLVTDDGLNVTGVTVLKEGGSMRDINARGGVVIATGGFSANPEMVDIYIGGWATRLSLRGSTHITGENILLTKPLFAKLVNMDQFYAGPIVTASHTNPAFVMDSGHGIIVSMQGKRVIDEAESYVGKAKMLPQVTKENRAFFIINDKTPMLAPVLKKYERLNNPIYIGNTIAEMAKAAGLPVEATVATVNEYNKAVKAKKAALLTPPNSLQSPNALEEGPFYALEYEGGLTATFGGPKINGKAQVVNFEDRPIKGLYAAGNAAGGLCYFDDIGGSQLGSALVFGRIAAAETVLRAKNPNSGEKK